MLKGNIFHLSRHCEIYFSKKINAVRVNWKGIIAMDAEFRSIQMDIIRALKQSEAYVILADMKQLQILWKNDRDWIVNFWYPEAIKAGLRFHAMIINKEDSNEYSLNKIIERYDDGIVEVECFVSASEAMKWVRRRIRIRDERLHYQIPELIKKQI